MDLDSTELESRLTRIETKLDTLIEGDLGLPSRVSVLEDFMNWAKGAIAVAGALGAILGAMGGLLLNKMGLL